MSRLHRTPEHEPNRRGRLPAILGLVGGTLLTVSGLLALDKIEAETPDEAYMSTDLLGRELFLSKDEVPYAVITGVGIFAVGLSGVSLLRDNEEK